MLLLNNLSRFKKFLNFKWLKIKEMKEFKMDDKPMKKVEAIIQSMTLEERHHPRIIDGSRKRRIARGSGTTVQEVNQLLKQFEQMKKMMKQMNKKSFRGFGGMPLGIG